MENKYYKGFENEMTVNGTRLETGVAYGAADVGVENFTAYKNPIGMLEVDRPGYMTVYAEVGLDDIISENPYITSACGDSLKIENYMGARRMYAAHRQYAADPNYDPDYKAPFGASELVDREKSAIAGAYGIAAAGAHGSALSEEYGTSVALMAGCAVTGQLGTACAGDCGIAHAGVGGTAVAGGWSRATSCDKGTSVTDACGFSLTENYGVAVTRYLGHAATGRHGFACAHAGWVRGGIGSALCATEYAPDDNYENERRILSVACGIVDGVNLLPDTWYKCVDGMLVEADK